ncbi:MAG TPA: class I SAM-dependent methyltransferase [Solirubrobacteraceae bacterium]|nr:class I SAM-dependent methyltransferase [Solirubrobacteraceae bacterium]
MAGGRPFYSDFGWAYDLLVDDPAEPWVDAVEAALARRGVSGPARILDAGCGTGRHAALLAARGHAPVLLEPVAELLDQARERLPEAVALRGDLSVPPPVDPVDAATCRGVLNDVIADEERDAALRSLAAVVRPGGALVLDVREREATAARYGAGRTLRREAGGVVFTSEGRWDAAAGLVRVHERHEAGGRAAEHDFAMRPWTEAELRERLARAGWREVEIAPGVGDGRGDRRLVVASR